MKKIFFSVLAIAAIAACSKSEVQYEDANIISFAPVAHNITKSVAGVDASGNYLATFPTDLNLHIFANVQDEDENGLLDTWTTEYLDNALFVSDRITTNSYYEGKPARYWPNVKSLIFAGYSTPSEDPLTAEMNFGTNELVISGYVQDNTKGFTTASGTTTLHPGVNELMWFPYDESDYSKDSDCVPAPMKHACSWITVKVLRDENTTDATWELKGLTINDLNHTGVATCNATEATWQGLGDPDDEVLFTSGGSELTTTATVLENVKDNMIVIPQKPTTIDVTYSYVPQTGVARVSETVKGLKLKLTENENHVDNIWKSGKHYIYTITITATEILVSPTVSGWDTYTVVPEIPAVPNN